MWLKYQNIKNSLFPEIGNKRIQRSKEEGKKVTITNNGKPAIYTRKLHGKEPLRRKEKKYSKDVPFK